MTQREEKTVSVAGHEIRIHELSTEEESKIRVQSQVWNQKKKIPEVDQASLDANMIFYSVVEETWPKDFGELSAENIRKLPTKYTRKLLFQCQRLNILDSDVADFLGSQSSSDQPATGS
ncbi:MAG: hypothetical protein ACYC7D_05355 [Nitrososphaerales archaeon]